MDTKWKRMTAKRRHELDSQKAMFATFMADHIKRDVGRQLQIDLMRFDPDKATEYDQVQNEMAIAGIEFIRTNAFNERIFDLVGEIFEQVIMAAYMDHELPPDMKPLDQDNTE